jgi:hypothetical protein
MPMIELIVQFQHPNLIAELGVVVGLRQGQSFNRWQIGSVSWK